MEHRPKILVHLKSPHKIANIKDGTINKFKSRVSNYKKKTNDFVILKYFIIS